MFKKVYFFPPAFLILVQYFALLKKHHILNFIQVTTYKFLENFVTCVIEFLIYFIRTLLRREIQIVINQYPMEYN